MPEPPCTHPDFAAAVTVNRLEDTGRYVADITVQCAVCGVPFRWLGLPPGLAFDRPLVSMDGLELRAPIAPEGRKRLATHSTYHVGPAVTDA